MPNMNEPPTRTSTIGVIVRSFGWKKWPLQLQQEDSSQTMASQQTQPIEPNNNNNNVSNNNTPEKTVKRLSPFRVKHSRLPAFLFRKSAQRNSTQRTDVTQAPRNINEAMSLDCGSSTFGSCSQSEFRHDSELDIRVMRTLNDVKFRHRPKFPVFGDVNFQRECLEAHNAVRQRHGCPPLEWSQELADLARTWAERLVEKGRILYPELPGLGENIYLGSARDLSHLPSGQELGERWANEQSKHDYDKPRWRPDSQHFTQMVWRVTYEMGASRCWLPASNQFAIVCFYRPGGNSNSPGEFCLNVPRPLSPSELADFDSITPSGLSRGNDQLNLNSEHSPVGELPGAFRRKLLISDSPPQSTVSDSHFLCKRGGASANNGKYKKLMGGHQQMNNCNATVSCSDGPNTASSGAGGSAKSTPAKRTSTTNSRRARFWLWNKFRRHRQPPTETTLQSSKQSTSKAQQAQTTTKK